MKKNNESIQFLRILNKKSAKKITEVDNKAEANQTSDKKESVNKKNLKKNTLANQIASSAYKSDNVTKRKFSVFSSLNILNRNSDLFKGTKNSVATIVKTIYSPEEIKSLMQHTNSTSYENLVIKIERALEGKDNQVAINSVASNVKKFVSQLKAQKEIDFVEHNTNNDVVSMFKQFENGPQALVRHVSNVYGNNRYFEANAETYLGIMTPLFTKFENDKEADEQIFNVEKHIKDAYNYTFKLDNKNRVSKRAISLNKYQSKMDNCVNMLYSVARTLTGSKNVSLKMSKALLDKNETNDFLNAKRYVRTAFKQGYEYNGKIKSINKIFTIHSDEIEDVVATLTTIFMARFVFDHKYFAQIERDLTEQASYKMQNLAISVDPNEDYWINQLIEERVKLNVAQVCASNNITNANQLIEIYNNNGTKIVHPEKVNSINDLVFALQYNTENEVNNKKLENVVENEVITKPTVKKSNIKIKPYKFKKEKPNKYLDSIRKTDEYKKYYDLYLLRLKGLTFVDEEMLKEELEEIKNASNQNLENIERIGNREEGLSQEDKQTLIESSAINDSINTICDEQINTQKREQTNSETEVLTQKPIENFSNETRQLSVEDLGINVERNDENLNFSTSPNKNETINYQMTNNQYSDAEQLSIYDYINYEQKDEQNNATQISLEEAMNDLTVLSNDQLPPINTEMNLILNPFEEEKETKLFSTQKQLKDLTDAELYAKIKKHYQKLINGANGKPGVIAEKLSYRIINKKTSKNDNSVNDMERLDDNQFKNANKIRDKKVEQIIEDMSEMTLSYFKQNKQKLEDNIKVPKLCVEFAKYNLDNEEKTFTVKNLKNFLSVYITKEVNPELKDLNLELYTGKKTFKEYADAFENTSLEAK